MATYPWDDGWSLIEVCAFMGLIMGCAGLIGNLLMTWICNLAEMATLSTSLFMTAMALTDSVVLVFHLLEDLGNFLPGTTSDELLHGTSDWRCRITSFIYDWTFMLSSWTIVGIAAELFLVQTFPSRRHLLYNSRRALYVVSSMMLIALAGCFPVSVITWFKSSIGECSSDYERFYDVYHNVIIQLLINGTVPIVIVTITLGKCAIANLFAKTEGTVTEVNAEDNTIKIQELVTPTAAPTHLIHVVVAFAVMFVVTMTPYIALNGITVLQRHDLIDYETGYNMQNALAVVRLILHANYSLKAIVAFVLSRTFRNTFRIICNYGSTVHSKSLASLRGELSGSANGRHTRSELYSTEGQPGVAAGRNSSTI